MLNNFSVCVSSFSFGMAMCCCCCRCSSLPAGALVLHLEDQLRKLLCLLAWQITVADYTLIHLRLFPPHQEPDYW